MSKDISGTWHTITGIRVHRDSTQCDCPSDLRTAVHVLTDDDLAAVRDDAAGDAWREGHKEGQRVLLALYRAAQSTEASDD